MGDMFKGDKASPKADLAGKNITKAIRNWLPGITSAINAGILPTEEALLGARQTISPAEEELAAQLYQTYAPKYGMTDAETELARLQGPGGQAALEAAKIDRQIDPEFYATRQASSQKILDMLNNPLTGGEITAIERGLNQSGVNRGLDNISTGNKSLNAALTFGNAARDRLGQALAQATQALPGFKSTGNTFEQATGRGTGNAIGQLDLTGKNRIGDKSQEIGTQFLGGLTDQEIARSSQDSQRRGVPDYFEGAVGSVCCFIFMESYNGLLPWFVRYWRDHFYAKDKTVAKGYCRLAKILVPLMQRSSTIRSLINLFMVVPITEYGGYLSHVQGFEQGKHRIKYFKFWMKTWKFLGKV